MVCEPTSRGLNSAVNVLRAPPEILTGKLVVGPIKEIYAFLINLKPKRMGHFILPLTETASSELAVPSTVMSNLATSPAATNSMFRKDTETRLVSAILHTNGQPMMKSELVKADQVNNSAVILVLPGTVSPLNLISMEWDFAISGVKLTKHFPPPKTWTWLGTSPSLMEISN